MSFDLIVLILLTLILFIYNDYDSLLLLLKCITLICTFSFLTFIILIYFSKQFFHTIFKGMPQNYYDEVYLHNPHVFNANNIGPNRYSPPNFHSYNSPKP
jgi:hypothetical protein